MGTIERQHLEEADRRIADALRRITEQESLIAERRLSGEDLDHALALLASMHRTLQVFQDHRGAIAKVIEVSARAAATRPVLSSPPASRR
jgi:hypothetical protein